MKIIKLKVEGYRSFKAQEWYPGDLNVLIGPNGSGKSNLLRLIELVSTAATGDLASHVQREGGMEPMVWDGQANCIQIHLKMTPLPPYSNPTTDALTYALELGRLGASSSYRIDREVLGNFYKVEIGAMFEPVKLLERDAHHAIVYSMDAQQFMSIATGPTTTTTTTPYPGNAEPIEAPQNSLPEEETLLSFAAGPFAANPFVAGFQQEVSEWKVHHRFHTHREAAIRGPQVTRLETTVHADGQNLIAVLHSLYSSNREFKNDVNLAMRSAFGDDFDELTFPPAADQRIQLRIRWKSLKREQSAADLSDGTLRFLFLLAILANPNPPPLIAIDEPETGLHPSMLPIVAEFAREASTKSQVILTTHSPEFLDAFGSEPPSTTIVDWEHGETKLRTLSGEELRYWLSQYTLGQLYRSQELEAMK